MDPPVRAMSGSFRDRARFEASRYGSDPWVFVRELLQNARDAGARRIAFEVRAAGAGPSISCRDDGSGMTFAHARRFLFTLYTSSKERETTSAGRFGVGFWSILRFEPERITIRSWPRRGAPWQVMLEGDLARGSQGRPEAGGPPGTEIVLARSRDEPDLERRVHEAAWRAGRFLARRDRPGEPLVVTVNGRVINAAFRLPPPSLSFRRARLRGAVGLGSAPAIELFSKGLLVRSAPCLQDLLSPAPGERGEEPAARAPSIEGVAPRGVLESDEIELLLARGDARDDRSLRRLVRVAQRETDRLLARQLECLRPRPLRERLATGIGLAGAAVLAAALVAGSLWPGGDGRPQGPDLDGGTAFVGPSKLSPASAAAVPPPAYAPTIGYHDLGGGYPGPRMEGLGQSFAPIRLRYAPARLRLHLAALIVSGLDEGGRVKPATDLVRPTTRYAGSRCEAGCVDVQLLVGGGGTALRLPVPTGHRLDPDSVTISGRPLAVFASEEGQPIVRPDVDEPVLLTYRTGPAAHSPGGDPEPSALPAAADRAVAGLRLLPREARVTPAVAWVRRAVRYSTAPNVIARHRAAEAEGRGFVERSLAVGAGDCDVQNGVLALVLQASGVPARLAIGYLGEGGSVAPWLHAWVEYADRPGPWRIADASQGAGPAARALAPPLPAGVAAPLRSDRAYSRLGPAALAGGAALAATVALVLARRTRRRLRLDPRGDLPRLLLGALQQPEAFGWGSAVFRRRLVPLARGRPLSLARAWDLAARGELHATGRRGAFALEAARCGWRVVDAGRPEGATVAEALGAIDLDEWERLLARVRTGPLLDALNRHLRLRGEMWSVGMAPGVAPSPTVVRRPGRVLLGASPDRIVILDEREAWLVAAAAMAGARPAEALFTVADRLAGILDLPGPRSARLLAPLARAAAREAAPC